MLLAAQSAAAIALALLALAPPASAMVLADDACPWAAAPTQAAACSDDRSLPARTVAELSFAQARHLKQVMAQSVLIVGIGAVPDRESLPIDLALPLPDSSLIDVRPPGAALAAYCSALDLAVGARPSGRATWIVLIGESPSDARTAAAAMQAMGYINVSLLALPEDNARLRAAITSAAPPAAGAAARGL